jgi:hypothetical protein
LLLGRIESGWRTGLVVLDSMGNLTIEIEGANEPIDVRRHARSGSMTKPREQVFTDATQIFDWIG